MISWYFNLYFPDYLLLEHLYIPSPIVCLFMHLLQYIYELSWSDTTHGSYIRVMCKCMNHSLIFSNATFSVRPFLTILFKIKTITLFDFLCYIYSFLSCYVHVTLFVYCLFMIRMKPLRSKEFWRLFKIVVQCCVSST